MPARDSISQFFIILILSDTFLSLESECTTVESTQKR